MAQAISMSEGDLTGEAQALIDLGCIYLRQEQYGLAEEQFAQARTLCALATDEEAEAEALDWLMPAAFLQRKFDDLRSYCMDACGIYTRLGKPMSKRCVEISDFLRGLEDGTQHARLTPKLVLYN
ncbi:hypothetical protein FRB90_001043 [Tulasnella sp. 427]|nr:hypothetical protein FRB90_001043 [Tulasnella sp. 427]